MKDKLEMIRNGMTATMTITGGEIFAGAAVCILAGIILGFAAGMAGKGIHLRIALGSYNGSQNRNNGNGNCDNGSESHCAGKSENQ